MIRRFFLSLMLIALLSACAGQRLETPERPWAYADLRALDPSDDPNPSSDITAVYVREIGSDLQIRIDLLDIPLIPNYTLDLLLDTRPGGSTVCPLQCATTLQWDFDIHIPAEDAPSVFKPNLKPVPKLTPRVMRDPALDTLTLSLNRNSLPAHFCFQVFALSNNTWPDDQSAVVCSDDPPPQTRAPLLLAFYDTFEAQTPAQALRAWDGAHTGPLGARHGLGMLVEAAARYQIPIALLDLKTPARLSALDTVGGTGGLHDLLAADLLLTPDVVYAQPADVSLAFSRQSALDFGFPTSLFLYGAVDPQSGYRFQFAGLPQTDHLVHAAGITYIPLPPSSPETLPTPDGPTLALRRQILQTALSQDPTDMVLLGGDLAQSVWGSPDYIEPTLAYLAARPWVWLLNQNDLQTFPTRQASQVELLTIQNRSAAQRTDAQQKILSRLLDAPANTATTSAWSMFFALTAPTGNPDLAELRSQYLGQVNLLLAASQWGAKPDSIATCEVDLDGDGRSECILASDRMYAIFDPQGAHLEFLFTRDQSGIHQMIGPSSQLALGLSDPSQWNPKLGEASDPGVTPGAFTDQDDPWGTYTGKFEDNRLIFTAQNGTRVKSFELTGTGLRSTYQSKAAVTTQIPLIVEPQAGFHPGWAGSYRSQAIPGGFSWGPQNNLRLAVQAEGQVSIRSFNESLTWLTQPEDPDFAYPPGHYLPFPLAMVQISGPDKFTIQLDVIQK
jgi:hypothetical protein